MESHVSNADTAVATQWMPQQRVPAGRGRVLVAYGSGEGHTRKIAATIADVLRDKGLNADLVDLKHDHGPNVSEYDGVLIGASIHMGKYQRAVRHYVRLHRDALTLLPSAFFSVSLAAHDDTPAGHAEVSQNLERFVLDTGWRPSKVAVFAGALLFTHYGFINKRIMRKISTSKGNPDADFGRDYDYTDWDAVKRFAAEFADRVGAELEA